MVEVNFTVEIGLPVPGSSIREGYLYHVECVAQQARPGGDIDVYLLLLEGYGTEQLEHRIEVMPKGIAQPKIVMAIADEIWSQAYSDDVTTRLEEAWGEVISRRHYPRRAENVGAL